MRKALLILFLSAGLAAAQSTSNDTLSLYKVNFIPVDSLKIADSLGVNGRGSLTSTASVNDTVTVTGVVMADPGITINGQNQFSAGNTDFYIQSPDSAEWGGMNVFGLSTIAQSIGLSSVDTGYVITLTGVISKYSATSICGNFEMVPTANQTIGISNIQNRPAPVEIKLNQLVTGDLGSGGKMLFDTGTKYKNSYVIIRNLSVKSRTQSSSSGQWTVILMDSAGNTISLYDPSKYFTGRSWGSPKWTPPPQGSKIDYIRGVLSAYASYGYEILPLYPGDVKVSAYTPSITATGFSTRRSSVFPKPTDPVTVRIYSVNPNPVPTAVDSTALYYSVDNGGYSRLPMTLDTANTYYATIPPQSDGSLVKYFFKAWSSDTLVSLSPDTSKAPLFYYVRANGYTIKDVQYTPFKDGISGVIDLPVTVQGIVQADSTDYPAEIDEENQSTKTPYAYMQDAGAPWHGIMLYGALANKLHRGDNVSLSGSVSMYNSMTEITVDSSTVSSSGNQLYLPVKIKTSSIGQRASGDSLARQWQGVLVEYDSVHITNNDPDGPSYSIHSANGSFREYLVNDGSGDTRVDDDGSNTFSVDPHDTLWGFHTMPQGAFFKGLIGVIKYKNSEYKLEPRTNSDFVGEIDAVNREGSSVPSSFSLSQNYPNPFNPSTTIRYSISRESSVSLKVYNVLGQQVMTLVNRQQIAGNYTVSFDASKLASGVYFYRLNAGSFNQVKKMLLLK